MRPRVRRRQCSFLGKFAISFNSEAVGRIEHSRPEPRDRAVDLDSECWQMRANYIGNMTWRQVPIVFANHARIRMPPHMTIHSFAQRATADNPRRANPISDNQRSNDDP